MRSARFAARRRRSRRRAAHPRHRQAMVVGGALRAAGEQTIISCSQTSCTFRSDSPVELTLRHRCHSQLLGALARGQGRHDSRADEATAFCRRASRRVPRPMRRVLRRSARADGALRHRASPAALRRLARAQARPVERAARSVPEARSRCVLPGRAVTRVTRCAARRRRGTIGPDLTHVGSRARSPPARSTITSARWPDGSPARRT